MSGPSGHAADAPTEPWLKRMPTSLFAMVMGCGGLAIAWRKAHEALGAPAVIGETLMGLAAAIFAVVLALHLARAVAHPRAHYDEFHHPVGAYFIPTFSVALAIMAGGLAPYDIGTARVVWIVAASVHLFLAFFILRRWFFEPREAAEVSPSWFIPVIGTILMPVIGLPLGFELASWFLFSIGATFWIILAPIMTHRLFFLGPLSEKALPSTFILLAPPAVGGLAIYELGDNQLGPLTHVLLGFATFLAVLMFSAIGRVAKTHFSVSWWALTFPTAAYASYVCTYAVTYPDSPARALSWLALAAATGLVATVAALTATSLLRGELVPKD